MTSIDQAKSMAKRLRSGLAAREIDIPHATALELVAAQLGHDNWNVAAARLDSPLNPPVAFERAIPILRTFDEAKSREFYLGFLGFAVSGSGSGPPRCTVPARRHSSAVQGMGASSA